MSIALASAQPLLAGSPADGCPGAAAQADTCRDLPLQRVQAAISGESGSKCPGVFLLPDEMRLAARKPHAGRPGEIVRFGGTDPDILLRPPRV